MTDSTLGAGQREKREVICVDQQGGMGEGMRQERSAGQAHRGTWIGGGHGVGRQRGEDSAAPATVQLPWIIYIPLSGPIPHSTCVKRVRYILLHSSHTAAPTHRHALLYWQHSVKAQCEGETACIKAEGKSLYCTALLCQWSVVKGGRTLVGRRGTDSMAICLLPAFGQC